MIALPRAAAHGPPPHPCHSSAKDSPMTYQQSLDLTELEADFAWVRYLEALEADEHPEIIELLNIEATIARHNYYEAYSADLAP